MRFFFQSAPIIGVLVTTLALSGCSAVRLGYNNGPTFTYWWLDSYFDFDGAQSPRVRDDLQAMQDWHRKQELPLLIRQIKDLRAMAPKPVTTEQVCAVVSELQTRLQVTLERVVPTIAAIAPGLQDAQLEHMAQKFDRRDQKWSEEWINGTQAERAQRRLKQIVERAESFYGPLETAQLAILRNHVKTSSFDGPRQMQEMQRRHQDALEVLRDIRKGKISPANAVTELSAVLARTLKAPDPAYRTYMDTITTESCAAMTALHNSSTTEQRTHLAQTLLGYEEDARALASQSPAPPSTEPSPSPM